LTNNIPNNEENSDEIETKVQIFSNKDEKLKFLGKMLNSDSSRAILLLLIEKEMTANEIADESKQSLSLVIHHLNKMMQSDIVTISKTISNTRNQPMKYYTAKSGILILPENASKKAKESKSFSNSLKTIMKFSAIGIIGFLTWFYDIINSFILNRGIPTGEVVTTSENLNSLELALIIIIIGLIIERIFSLKKRKN